MKRINTILKAIPNVQNMMSNNGNIIPNQFEIFTNEGKFFQSYSSVIAAKLHDGRILLDKSKWDYSVTTSKYRNLFLGMNKKEIESLIESGEIKLVNLN